MNFNDMWFHLVNSNDMIIGCCSAKIEDNKYIFDDVYVEEEFRGHNYAKLLLLYAMKSVRTNNDNASFQITVHDYNTPAVKTYSKIFGKPIRVENNMFLYSGITENELEIQLKKSSFSQYSLKSLIISLKKKSTHVHKNMNQINKSIRFYLSDK
jgi:predicted GNAT family N-acyltransferase